ncbi:hypothetical protein K438DRAFT_1985192 [Mycena galopus ATCC 62051]|nr:hypothetical protein K438DRAFT_1985192 [Mycena galopus ATCC 62051]
MHKYWLRVGQAVEALHDVHWLLLVRTHLYKLKDTHSQGMRANMRSSDKIAALNDQTKQAARGYRAARSALVGLGKEVKRDELECTLQPLAEDGVRGLPQSWFHDPERKKKGKKRQKVKRQERPVSWIWAPTGERWDPADDVAMNEGMYTFCTGWSQPELISRTNQLCVSNGRRRARAMRWAEEVDLLEEEMRCIGEFLKWRSRWWMERVDGRGAPEGPQHEGKAAYATHQAAIQATLATEFAGKWAGLADLIRRGRAGELLEEGESDEKAEVEEEEEEDAADDSGEEEEAIPALPSQTVKATYVDKVLAM